MVGGSGYLCFFLNFGSFCLQQCKQCVQGCVTRLVVCEQKKRKINESFIINKESIQKSSYGAQWNVPNPTKETVKSSLSGLQDNEAYIVIQYVPCEVCAVPKLPNRARGAVMDQQQSP